jgi:ribosomal protein S18 acetylase RimI-like enzyme
MAAGVPGLAGDGAGPPEPGLFFLSLVYVVPHRWGEGIGGRLVDALLGAARAEGYDRAHLWTHKDDNSRAQRLYEGRGFRQSGVEKNDEAGERIIRYERHLSNAKAEGEARQSLSTHDRSESAVPSRPETS